MIGRLLTAAIIGVALLREGSEIVLFLYRLLLRVRAIIAAKDAERNHLRPGIAQGVFGTIDTVNFFVEKDLGHYAEGRPNFLYVWETRFALGTPIEAGFQAYGEHSLSGRFLGDQRLGPVLFGVVARLGPGALRWNAGVLFGLTPAAPRETIR
jgi:hypothetical protein